MRARKAARAVLVIAAMAVSLAAQSRMAGNVVEVTDGKTVVIDTGGRRFTAEIQFIEIPEPEQQLRATVRDHLEKLTLGKPVEFRSSGFSSGKILGQLFVGDLDVAIQLLRDGAAWHIPAETSGQDQNESKVYEGHQEQARSEKRGVWGVNGLKPAWEFRAEKTERVNHRSAGVGETLAAAATSKPDTAITIKKQPARPGPWSDANPWLKNPGPLVNGYNAASKTGYVGTSFMSVREQDSQSPDQKTSVDVSYLYKQNDGTSRTGTFVLTVVSSSNEERFLKSNNVNVVVDEKNYPVGKPKRTMAREEGKVIEKLTYEMPKATVEKMVYGGEVFIKIGNYMLYPTSGFQLLLYNMLQAAD